MKTLISSSVRDTIWICGWMMQYPHQKGNMGRFLGGSCNTRIKEKQIDWFMGGWCNTCILQEKYISTMNKENKGKEGEKKF